MEGDTVNVSPAEVDNSLGQSFPAGKEKIYHKKGINVLSLFSGCGGMDIGFEGGFQIHRSCINKHTHPEWFLEKQKKDG